METGGHEPSPPGRRRRGGRRAERRAERLRRGRRRRPARHRAVTGVRRGPAGLRLPHHAVGQPDRQVRAGRHPDSGADRDPEGPDRQRRPDRVRPGRHAVRRHRGHRPAAARPQPAQPGRQDPAGDRVRQAAAGQPDHRLGGVQHRARQRVRAVLDRRPHHVRPGERRQRGRAQPGRRGARLRLARRGRTEPAGVGRTEAVRGHPDRPEAARRPARRQRRTRRAAGGADRHLRPAAYRRGRPRRLAVADHSEPRRPRRPRPDRRPGDPDPATTRVHHLSRVRQIVRRMTPPLLILTVVCALSGCDSANPSATPASPLPTSTSTGPPSTGPAPTPGPTGAPQVRVLARNLNVPWGLAFLPDGDALVAERPTGRILRVTPSGEVSEAQRLTESRDTGEGGLLGLAVSPDYARDGLVYAYYTGAANERKRAQDPAALNGKILRMTPDGRPAPGNPFPNSVVYSYGHRNVQGLAWDSAGRLYASEFGQNAFDEVNLIQAGRNYGWPIVEGVGHDARFVEPLVTWATDDASPSGIAIVGDQLFVAALRGERLWRVPLDGRGGLGEPVPLLVDAYGRLRTVAPAPDGSLWVMTSNRDGRGDPTADDDRILRITF